MILQDTTVCLFDLGTGSSPKRHILSDRPSDDVLLSISQSNSPAEEVPQKLAIRAPHLKIEKEMTKICTSEKRSIISCILRCVLRIPIGQKLSSKFTIFGVISRQKCADFDEMG